MVDHRQYQTFADSVMQDEDNQDIPLETIRSRYQDVIRRHAELTERLSRDSDKMIFERLQKEFEAARASQTEEISLEGEDWNDGLLATIREKVHMEADKKVMEEDPIFVDDSPFFSKITYKVGNKVICCLEGARIGIQYETSFAGEPCEIYHCVLESKSFLEKMTVLEHTIPFFLPIREAENDLLSSNAMKFIDHVGELLQAYVDRREQVRIIKELYGNQIGELSKLTVGLRYADLVSVLPTRIRVLAWPLYSSKELAGSTQTSRKPSGTFPSHLIPARLSYAEDALRTMSLPEVWIATTVTVKEVRLGAMVVFDVNYEDDDGGGGGGY
ncbi:hypothetical protein AKJ16_DCAP08904, partial [Drosera capensis]